jgi:S1-C subfamily serine protease
LGPPAYLPGIDSGDVITSIDGRPATQSEWNGLRSRQAGDVISVALRRRDGRAQTVRLTLVADPALQIVPAEAGGGTLTAAQRAFREAWLGAR